MEIRDRFAFSSWTAHPRCVLSTAEGSVDVGEHRFGGEVIGGGGGRPGGAQFAW